MCRLASLFLLQRLKWSISGDARVISKTSRCELVISQNRKSLSEPFNVVNRLIFCCNFYILHILSFELYFLNKLQNELHTCFPTWIFVIIFGFVYRALSNI
jgi:hypothetical protein